MQTIRETLNRIRWDPDEDPGSFVVGYEDRLRKQVIDIPYTDIIRIEDGFMVVGDGEETSIPLHRVRHVKKDGKVIWQRPIKALKETD